MANYTPDWRDFWNAARSTWNLLHCCTPWAAVRLGWAILWTDFEKWRVAR